MRFLLLLLVLLSASPAFADRKVALLIGNAQYFGGGAQLRNPPNDVAAMKSVLASSGFEIHDFTNLNRVQMSKALDEFEVATADADIGLVFYSGHGMEVNGTNYLIPIDATLASDRDAKYEAIDLNDVLQALSHVKKLKLVLLDACRDNPFTAAMKTSGNKGFHSKGLAINAITSESNMLIGYATSPGDVAQDGEGENSPFTKALVAHIVEPGVEVETALRAVAKDVFSATGGEQRPYKAGSIFETVMLGPEKSADPVLAPAVIAADPCRDASMHWDAIRNSHNRDLLNEHLRLFPTCAFSSLARLELASLDTTPAAPAADPYVQTAEPPPQDQQSTIIDVTPDETIKPKTLIQLPGRPVDVSQPLQNELARVGCYAGTADGRWGQKSEQALRAFNQYSRNDFDPTVPTEAILRAVEASAGRVCPLSCAPGETEDNGTCVARTCPAGQKLSKRGNCVAMTADAVRPKKTETPARAKKGSCFMFNGEKMCE